MNITVIGGSGFVGTRLLSQLQESDHTLRNIDKASSRNFPDISTIGDIRNPSSFEDLLEGADVVVLLAAEHRDDVSPISLYYDVNVTGTENVLEAMDRHGIKTVVFTSSVAVYGMNKTKPPTEEDPPDPFNHYGKSKWEAEEKIRAWTAKGEGRNALIIRPTVIFGEKNRGNVFNLLQQIHSGRFVMIGSGNNPKSMAYVGNIVAFMEHKLKEGVSGEEVFNYVDKPDLDMNTLVKEVYTFKGHGSPSLRMPYWLGLAGGFCFDILAFLTRKKFPISVIRVKKFCATTQFAAEKIPRSGFEAPFSLAEGLQRTLQSEFGEAGSTPETKEES